MENHRVSKKVMTINKDKFHKIILFLSNGFLIIGTFLVILYLLIPLFGGKLYVYAVLVYVSWIGVALALRLIIRRSQKRLRVRVHEYLVASLCVIFNLVISFGYTIGFILSIFSVVGLVFAYRVQNKKVMKT